MKYVITIWGSLNILSLVSDLLIFFIFIQLTNYIKLRGGGFVLGCRVMSISALANLAKPISIIMVYTYEILFNVICYNNQLALSLVIILFLINAKRCII